MLIVLLFVTFRLFGYSSSTVTFDEDLDDVGLLKCNWAQAYLDDEEIVDDAEIQHEIMLLASHWEGKFGRHGIGIDQDQGLLSGGVMEPDNYGCVADYDSGFDSCKL